MTNLEIKADVSIDDSGTVTGLAWPFGTPDSVGDVIEKGAFNFSNTMPMVMEHDQGKVVGVWETFAETESGLEVKGRLFLEGIGPARDAHQQLKAGKIAGLSIGFSHDGYEAVPSGRVFKSVKVTEISLCRRPVHPGARITIVKAHEEIVMENEEMKAALEATVKRIDTLEAKALRPIASNDNEVKAEKPEVKAFGTFLRTGIERMEVDEVKALTVASGTNGGFLAPAATGTELVKLLNERSPIRQYARVVSVSAPSITMPRRVSGTAATWVDETGNRTESGMTFEQITLTPHELATFTDVSNALLEDNQFDLEGELLLDFAESFGKSESAAFVNGDGVGKPKGILKAAGVKEVASGAAGGLAATNPADAIIKLYHAIPTLYAQDGAWLMNRASMQALRLLKDSDGRYLMADPITALAPTTLLGRPIIEVPDMDDLAAGKNPIVFGDFTGYRIIDRVELAVLRDPYSIATKGQVRFHARKRVGGDVTHPDRFAKLTVKA